MVANNEVPPGLAVWHSASSSVSVRDVCWHSCPRPPPCALWQQKEAASAGNQADGQRAATPLAKAAVWLEQWGVDANVKKKKKTLDNLDKSPFLFPKHEVKSCRPPAAAARWPWSCASSRGHAPPSKRLCWGQRVGSFSASVWRAVNQPSPLIC